MNIQLKFNYHQPNGIGYLKCALQIQTQITLCNNYYQFEWDIQHVEHQHNAELQLQSVIICHGENQLLPTNAVFNIATKSSTYSCKVNLATRQMESNRSIHRQI